MLVCICVRICKKKRVRGREKTAAGKNRPKVDEREKGESVCKLSFKRTSTPGMSKILQGAANVTRTHPSNIP